MMVKFGKLDKLKINGYKSIKSLEIEFNSINILIGANGVGKSNFIGFFNFIRKLVDKELELYVAQLGGANKILHFGKKVTNQLSFDLYFHPNRYKAILTPTDDDKFIFANEETYIDSSNKNYLPLNIGNKESVLPIYNQNGYGVNQYVMKYIKDWKVYHFHDTGKSSPMKQPCNINDYYSLAVDGHNLAAFLYYIKTHHGNSYVKIVKTIQRVAPFFHDFILEPDIINQDMIKLRWRHKGSDLYFDVNDLSDGTIRFICLTTLLLQPNLPTMILLDEPELGLHPFALQILASLFRVASNKTQIIASTQSSTFADFFDIEDIIIADTKENATLFQRLESEKYKEWFNEYSIGEMWQKNLIGGVPSYD
jgi:predicted ATPase